MKPIDTRYAFVRDSEFIVGCLFRAADLAADENISLDSRQCANKLMTNILNAAQSGGFKERDMLHTLLQRGDRSERVRAMAQRASTVIPNFDEILQKTLNEECYDD